MEKARLLPGVNEVGDGDSLGVECKGKKVVKRVACADEIGGSLIKENSPLVKWLPF